MPSILEPPASTATTTLDFVASVPLDLTNSLCFVGLADQKEGLDDFPVQTRARMDPALRAELDALLAYPGQPGVLGALNDALFLSPDPPADFDALLRYVRELPARAVPGGDIQSMQGLVLYALQWRGATTAALPAPADPRAAVEAAFAKGTGDDADVQPMSVAEALALFDEPERLRARLLLLLRRFYDEHYRADEERRFACMRRSVGHHRQLELRRREPADIEALLSTLAPSGIACISSPIASYSRFILLPSLDGGPYISVVDAPPICAVYYPCESQFRGAGPDDDDRTHRMALLYKALSDEQRLRILRELRRGELYAQEIVERTGVHQSVVSRHLSFLKAVGLVNVRRQNNMKFYSLNGELREELRQCIDAVLPASG